MKAAVFKSYGSAENVLKIQDIAKPSIESDELLVKVIATSVNRTDVALIQAVPFVSRFVTGLVYPKINVLGGEFSGAVVETGSQVTRFKTGDIIYGLSIKNYGAHAEYIKIQANGPIDLVPENIDPVHAAAICEGYWYATNCLRKIQNFQGSKVYIYGATGAIGSAALQLCKIKGAHVTAVCERQHIKTVQSLGADCVLDYEKDDFLKFEKQFDFVLDAVGKVSYWQTRPMIKDGGLYCSTDLGPYWENPFLALITPFLKLPTVFFPIPKDPDRSLMTYLSDKIKRNQYKPLVQRQVPFENIVQEFNFVGSGKKIGGVAIKL
jgi:NADPH:quinone reductase-like Zn-dependent oxidoreductase